MKISVITINFNNLNGLKQTIASVLSQTFFDFEYIIIDGGSKDGSALYIEENKGKFSYWVSEPDNGIYHAMNKGLKKAIGQYCLFLNSGDCLISNSVLQQLVLGLNDNVDVLYGDFQYLSKSFNNIERFPKKLSIYHFAYSYVPHTSSLIRTNLLIELNGYDESFNIISDWVFFLRALIEKKAVFEKINIVVTIYDINGISNTIGNKKNEEQLAAISKYFPFLKYDFEYFRELRYYKLSRSHQLMKKVIYNLKPLIKVN
jgi:glycosyltransferase involved in cell wall biosynthesis